MEDYLSSNNDFPKINQNGLKILEKRYFWKDEYDNLIESSWNDINERVSSKIASAERLFNCKSKYTSEFVKSKFYDMIGHLRFIPNTPTLTNAGRDRGQLAACFVLPLGDSMESIMDTLKAQAIIQKSGGGTGFNFGSIRERGALVKSTGQKAAGLISIIKFMNYMMTEFIIQGGIRYGANMGVLPVSHPDIEEFIEFKHADGSCASFNISIAMTDEFMDAVCNNGDWALVSPHTGKVTKVLKARVLYKKIAVMAHKTGDPGVLFIDTANRANPTPHIGRLEATNPCGEQWLLPNEACTLGHTNLVKYYKSTGNDCEWTDKIDWDQYREDIHWGVRFLDNVVEINHYAVPAIEKMHKHTNRKIGLGVMGFADLLIKLGVPYASKQAREIAEYIAKFHSHHADEASYQLALERGSFGAFSGSTLQAKWPAMRNACRTTVAPTGTTAIFADCSTGIEPVFALLLKREQASMTMYDMHPMFREYLDTLSQDNKSIALDHYNRCGTVVGCQVIPLHMQQIFKQANDIDVDDHILMQSVWQQYIDNSISKTINMPSTATVEDVEHAYMMAWETGCKGITIYRDKCRQNQTLSTVSEEVYSTSTPPVKSELCPECGQKLEITGGCESCKSCGWSVCKIG